MPGGDFHPVLFVIVAAWILVCRLGVVAFRNIVHSAVSMVFCFLGVAFAFALLNSELLAIIQILIYVGAISVVIIFAIMLTEVQEGGFGLFFNRQSVFAAPRRWPWPPCWPSFLISADICRKGSTALNPGVHAALVAALQPLRVPLRARLAGAAGGHDRRHRPGAQGGRAP